MARLTDQEKQEILRYMEEDKPLPDKYRFLLFEDKREVELVRVRKRPSSRVPFLKWIVEDARTRAGPTSSFGATTS